MAARRLSPPRWLTEEAADTSEMAQFGVGGNTRQKRAKQVATVAGAPLPRWSRTEATAGRRPSAKMSSAARSTWRA